MKIRIFKSRTVNLGNYNSTKFEFGIEEELSEETTWAELVKRQKKLDGLVDEWIETEHGKWSE